MSNSASTPAFAPPKDPIELDGYDSVLSFAKAHWTRGQALAYHANFTGVPFIDLRATTEYMRLVPEDEYEELGLGKAYDEWWWKCLPEVEGAFPFWTVSEGGSG
jgi:hypothetical protein